MINRILPTFNNYSFGQKSEANVQNLKLKTLNQDVVSFKSGWYTEETKVKDLAAKIISCFDPQIDRLDLANPPVTIDLPEIKLVIEELNSKVTNKLLSSLQDQMKADPLKYDKDEKLVWADTFAEVAKFPTKSRDDSLKKMHILTFAKDLYVLVLEEIGQEKGKDLVSAATMNIERQAAIDEASTATEKNINSINTALTDMIADYAKLVTRNYLG